MQYLSTRGTAPRLNFADAVLAGKAKDGGLYVPETAPLYSPLELERMRGLSYAELAHTLTWPFVEGCEISETENRELCRAAYTGAAWDDPSVVPVRDIGEKFYLAELFHGPTLAFKDLALQLFALQLDLLLERRGEKVTILGATSGDTGPAAIHALAGKRNAELFMLFPQGGTSEFQRRQMTTVTDRNIHAVAIEGVFDDCQKIVKSLNYAAVNSISWARIVAQIVYYFSTYFLVAKPREYVDFSVPTGNFGDIYAGWMARRMGLPVMRLIAATNENNIVEHVLRTGHYIPDETVPTTSPSQDIQVSSNIERLFYDLLGPAKVRALYEEFDAKGRFSIPTDALKGLPIRGEECDTDYRHHMMKEIYEKQGIIIDPHTANGVHGAFEDCDKDTPMIILSTASPAKFAPTIKEVLGVDPTIPARFADIGERPERCQMLPNDASAVEQYMWITLEQSKAA